MLIGVYLRSSAAINDFFTAPNGRGSDGFVDTARLPIRAATGVPPGSGADLLRGCHIAEALQRGLASAQLPQLLFAELFGAACHDPHSALDQYPAEGRIGRRGSDVTEGAQQPQADGYVRLRIHADLVKGRVQQALKVDPSNAGANHA